MLTTRGHNLVSMIKTLGGSLLSTNIEPTLRKRFHSLTKDGKSSLNSPKPQSSTPESSEAHARCI